MATTPTLQPRSQFHRDWGVYANAAGLPNASGNPLPTPEYNKLEVGQYAYVQPGVAGGSWAVCDAIGTPGGGDAVWTLITAADHQAPRIIVGNASAGDTAAVCDYLDPGDGTGIAAAVAAANALGFGGTPVDIHIRPGSYFLAPALVATGFVIQTDMAVRGAGQGKTILVGGSVPFPMLAPFWDARSAGSVILEDMSIIVGETSAPAATFAVMHATNAKIRRINVLMTFGVSINYAGGFGMYLAGYPDGVLYEDIEVSGVTSDIDFAAIRIDSGGQRGSPTSPLRIERLTVNGTPALNFYSGVFLTDVGEAFIDHVSVVGMPNAIRLLYAAPFGSYTRGPIVNDVYHRVDASAYQGFAVRLQITANVGMTLFGPSFTDIVQEPGPGVPAGGFYLFDVEVLGADNLLEPTMQNSTSRSSNGTTEAKIYVLASNNGRIERSRLVNVSIRDELQVQAGAGGTVDSPLLLGCESGDCFLNGANVLNAQVVSNRIRGVYTDTGTGTTNSVNIIGP